MKDWWNNSDNEIETVEAGESYWEALYGREIDDEWEYAITRWRHGSPTLILSFKAGKVTGGIDHATSSSNL